MQNISFQRVREAVSHWEEMSSLKWHVRQRNFTEALGRHPQKFFSWFEKTGNKLIEFDVTYFIQRIGPGPKIIMFIAHQDEERAMKELGLV